eukprot:612324-Prymnesium_polylepis.1
MTEVDVLRVCVECVCGLRQTRRLVSKESQTQNPPADRGVGGCGASAVSRTRRPGSLAGVAGGWRAATHRYGALKPAVLPSAHVPAGP